MCIQAKRVTSSTTETLNVRARHVANTRCFISTPLHTAHVRVAFCGFAIGDLLHTSQPTNHSTNSESKKLNRNNTMPAGYSRSMAGPSSSSGNKNSSKTIGSNNTNSSSNSSSSSKKNMLLSATHTHKLGDFCPGCKGNLIHTKDVVELYDWCCECLRVAGTYGTHDHVCRFDFKTRSQKCHFCHKQHKNGSLCMSVSQSQSGSACWSAGTGATDTDTGHMTAGGERNAATTRRRRARAQGRRPLRERVRDLQTGDAGFDRHARKEARVWRQDGRPGPDDCCGKSTVLAPRNEAGDNE